LFINGEGRGGKAGANRDSSSLLGKGWGGHLGKKKEKKKKLSRPTRPKKKKGKHKAIRRGGGWDETTHFVGKKRKGKTKPGEGGEKGFLGKKRTSQAEGLPVGGKRGGKKKKKAAHFGGPEEPREGYSAKKKGDQNFRQEKKKRKKRKKKVERHLKKRGGALPGKISRLGLRRR